MAIHERYLIDVKDQLDYDATWLPGMLVAAGDVCLLEDRRITKLTTLADLGIEAVGELASVSSSISFTSQGSVGVDVKLKGAAALPGSPFAVDEAGLTISFATAGATLLQLDDCMITRIADLHRVGQAVIRTFRDGRWPDRAVVVTEAIRSGASTVVMSSAESASIDLLFGGGGSVSIASLNLNGNVAVRQTRNVGLQIISEPGLTPLVRMCRPRRSLFGGGAVFSTREVEAVAYSGDDDHLVLTPAGYFDEEKART